MKRILLVITCVLASMTMFAQQSMLDGDPVWVYRQSIGTTIKNAPKEVGRFDDEPLFYHIYYIKGDTTIQNRVYKNSIMNISMRRASMPLIPKVWSW